MELHCYQPEWQILSYCHAPWDLTIIWHIITRTCFTFLSQKYLFPLRGHHRSRTFFWSQSGSSEAAPPPVKKTKNYVHLLYLVEKTDLQIPTLRFPEKMNVAVNLRSTDILTVIEKAHRHQRFQRLSPKNIHYLLKKKTSSAAYGKENATDSQTPIKRSLASNPQRILKLLLARFHFRS